MKEKVKNMDWVTGGLLICSLGVLGFTLLQQRQQSEEALQQKNEVITELKNLVTGGNSFAYIKAHRVAYSNEILFSVEFKGKYPIYDATLTTEEQEIVPKDNSFVYKSLGVKSQSLGTISPLLSTGTLFKIAIPETGQNGQFGKHYLFHINARNGSTEQDLLIRQEGPHFSMANKVIFIEPNFSEENNSSKYKTFVKKIRHIDPAFPVHELTHLKGDTGWIGTYETATGTNITLPTETHPQTEGK